MENFIVSARKYRPVTFETVVGQQHITGTLKNAIKNNQLAQAFLFCGPRGVGKTTCARILAKTINCTQQSAEMEACGNCSSCISFQSGNSFNFHELDAASNNSVEDIRSLIEQVRIPPQAGKYKVYIIDEVHMLSTSAFNAFLKTLEEPPPYAIFILATTEKHKILPTILSRCQIFDFNRIQVEDIAGHLQKIAERENIQAEADGLHIIAQKADGGLRDALSMFDQIVSYTNKNLTYQSVITNLNILDYDYYFKLTHFLTSGDVSQALLLFNEILNNGFDGNHFINGLASHLRNLLVARDPQTVRLLEVSENIRQRYLEQGQQSDLSFILTALNLANQCDLNYKNSKNQRLQVELSLIKMCHIPTVVQLARQSSAPQATDPGQDKKKTLVFPEKKTIEPPNPSPPVIPIDSAPSSVALERLQSLVEKEELTDLPDHLSIPLPEKIPADPLSKEAKDPMVSPTDKIRIQPLSSAQKTSSLIPSLTDLERIAQGTDEEGPQYLKGNSQHPFTLEQLQMAWDLFAQKANEAHKINLYTLLTSHPPELGENALITVSVENGALESTLQSEKIVLLNFLRSQLQNFSIDIQTKRIESSYKQRIYTNPDKYKYLVEKNPQLDELRRRFNLDIHP